MTPTEKKQWEIGQGELVAERLNEIEGCDYTVIPAEQEPADIVLKSSTGRFIERQAQVVSIPVVGDRSDRRDRKSKRTPLALPYLRYRNDNDNLSRVEARLAKKLLEFGIRNLRVDVILSPEAEVYGIKAETLTLLAEIVVCEQMKGDFELRYFEINNRNSNLADCIHNLRISHHPELGSGVRVVIPKGSPVPTDEKWIIEGIRKKLNKYGGEAAVKDLTLIIGAAGFVDSRQVAAFEKGYSKSELPFAEIWINTLDGTYCLKKRYLLP